MQFFQLQPQNSGDIPSSSLGTFNVFIDSANDQFTFKDSSGNVQSSSISASYALTASYALNAGGGAGFPFTGSAEITGSLTNTGPFVNSGSAIITSDTYIPFATWTAGTGLITSRCFLAGAGTQNAALAFGGYTYPAYAAVSCTEAYDGTSWADAPGTLNDLRGWQFGGLGTQTAALAVGGAGASPYPILSCTEEYDGAIWTSANPLVDLRGALFSVGTQNAALAFGGYDISYTAISCTEKYDGTTWSTDGGLVDPRASLAGAGTQNSALAFGGYNPTVISYTEAYDGTTWIAVDPLITPRSFLSGVGTQNEALAFGGRDFPPLSCTEEYNGTTWSTSIPLNLEKAAGAGAGTQNAALSFGGYVPTSEQYNKGLNLCTTKLEIFESGSTDIVLKGDFIITGSIETKGTGSISSTCIQGGKVLVTQEGNGIWSIGGNLNTARAGLAGAGYQNGAVAFGGLVPWSGLCQSAGTVGCTELYYGDVWSTSNSLIQPRLWLAGAGVQNAALAFGGSYNNTPSIFNPGSCFCTEEYNGFSWTAANPLNISATFLAGAGTQNAALAFGGSSGVPSSAISNCTEQYDGTTWTTSGPLIDSRRLLAGAGEQNAALAFGGYTFTRVGCTEEYDGATWASSSPLSSARASLSGGGTQNDILAFGGNTNAGHLNCTEKYDGTSWSTGGALIIARSNLGAAGQSSVSLAFGGQGSTPFYNSTERYNNINVSLDVFQTNLDTVNVNGKLCVISGIYGGFIGSLQGIASNATCAVTASHAINALTASYASTATVFPFTGSAIVSGSLTATGSINHLGTYTNQCVTNTNYLNSVNIAGNTILADSVLLGVWSSGGGYPLTSLLTAAAGTQNSGVSFGGFGGLRCTYEYDGSVWTAGGLLITGRQALAGAGTQNSSLAFGGRCSGYFGVSCTEEYNGTSWSTGGLLINLRYSLAGAGTQNSALAFGGVPSYTEEYDGASWTSGGALITARDCLAGAGTQNAALATGGIGPYPFIIFSCTEEYNGTSWTNGGALNIQRLGLAGAGTQNAGLAFGGSIISCNTPLPASERYLWNVKCTEEYDGSNWSINAPLICGRTYLAGAGTQTEALAVVGANYGQFPARTSFTEEYNRGAYSKYSLDVFRSDSSSVNLKGSLVTSGSLSVTGSITLQDMLVLGCQSTLPLTAPSGAIMTSGSGADFKPYFWNGTTWTPLF